MITNLRKFVAIGASVGVVALGGYSFAQEDINTDDLLKDLESPASAESTAEKAKETVAEAAEAAKEEVAEAAETVAEAAEAVKEAAETAETEPKEEEAQAEETAEAEGEAAEEEAAEPEAEVVEDAAEPAAEAAEPEADAASAAEAADVVNEMKAEVAAEAAEKKAAADDNISQDELLSLIETAEKNRRESYDAVARQEIEAARKAFAEMDYDEAIRRYVQARKLINDSPSMKEYAKECLTGIAESFYRAGMQEDRIGRRDRAMRYMEKAVNMRHPKARKQLEAWKSADDPEANKTDISEISHRRNDEDYKELRKKNAAHLKRATHFMTVRDLDRALDECELVLVTEPFNQDAIRLRRKIQKKRALILGQEKKATREGMIADVDKAWRPPYAVNAREYEDAKAKTVKSQLEGEDPVRAAEQEIIERMKKIKLPAISFKPPATIIDAVDYFRGASKDFDNPELPIEKRGFNFVLRTPEVLKSQAAAADSDDFSETGDEEEQAVQAGVPIIPMITATDITFYDALKLVCEAVDYKFRPQGPIVIVMHKSMSVEEMVTRSFPAPANIAERVSGVSGDIKDLASSGGFAKSLSASHDEDDGEDSAERDWKSFFSLMGVEWPEGSSIFYVKSLGKLMVKNTYENIAVVEKLLSEFGDQKLIEIETRFVEVCQEDLNSLGFEWILNSDYSLDLGHAVNKALNLKGGKWGETSSSTSYKSSLSDTTATRTGTDTGYNGSTTPRSGWGTSSYTDGATSFDRAQTYTTINGGAGNRWSRDLTGGKKTMGINAFGGTSDQANGMRYLSTVSNPIAGESASINDQFMRFNAFIGNADLSMILHMLSQRSDTDLLSAPKVLTRQGEEAVIKVVTEYIYPTDYDVQLQSSSSGSGGNNGGSSQSAILAVVEPQSFTMREVGVILDVTPLLNENNVIDLKLSAQIVDEPTWKNYGMKIPFTGNSSLQNFMGLGEIFSGLSSIFAVLGNAIPDALKATLAEQATASAGDALNSLTAQNDNMTYYDAPMEQPFFHVRSVESNVSIYPGATIVMGGLITEQRQAMDDKIPFLGDIPFIGRLFRSHSEKTTKRNLLIFITSRLVDFNGREVTIGNSQLKSGDDVVAAPDGDGE